MTAINGINAAIYAASGTSTATTNEAMTDLGDHLNYFITNTAKRYWDDSVVPTFQESTDSGSTWHALPAAVTTRYAGGYITFAVARNATYQYRAATVNYFTITTIGGAHEWQFTYDQDLLDATEFGQAWHTFVPGTSQGTASVMRWYVDTYFSSLLLTGNQRTILALYVNTGTGARYEGYAFLKQSQLKLAELALVDVALSFTLDKTWYYNPGP